MTHDFANQKKPKNQNNPTPPWLLIVTGVAIGLFGSLLFKLIDVGPVKDPKQIISEAQKLKKELEIEAGQHQSSRSGQSSQNAEDSGKNKELDKFTHKPRFDFYTILPEQETFVPNIKKNVESEKSTSPTSQTSQRTNLPKATYLLQTGSFREYSEAHKLKGKLVLSGLDVKIQTVTLNNGETWHRVQVGPYDSERALAKAQNTLAKINIDSMVLKKKL